VNRVRIWLSKAWELLKQRVGKAPVMPGYCIECGACGEDGCCKAEMCRGGLFCSGYYGPVRKGPVNALVTLRRQAEEDSRLMSPVLVKLAPGEVSPHETTVYGWPMPEGMREETWEEYRARIAEAYRGHG
jgi:hypothetical protein